MLTFGVIKEHDNLGVKMVPKCNFISSSQSELPTENSGNLWQFLVVYGLPLIQTLDCGVGTLTVYDEDITGRQAVGMVQKVGKSRNFYRKVGKK